MIWFDDKAQPIELLRLSKCSDDAGEVTRIQTGSSLHFACRRALGRLIVRAIATIEVVNLESTATLL